MRTPSFKKQQVLKELEETRKKNAIQQYLQDILNVGPHKPLGYVAGELVEGWYERGTGDLIEQCQRQGNQAIRFNEDQCSISRWALYVRHEITLQKFLDTNKHILETSKRPTKTDEFVEQVANIHAPQDTPLFTLIAQAFGN